MDGLWCSFAAAYFVDLRAQLASWKKSLKPGGWIALTEIDDLFAHEPLSLRTKSLLDGYAHAALSAHGYDFRMGRKLRDHLLAAGFTVSDVLMLEDGELAFDGPAAPEVVEAWSRRLDRMTPLRDFCGAELDRVREEFLACLTRADHRCLAKVYCCIGSMHAVNGMRPARRRRT